MNLEQYNVILTKEQSVLTKMKIYNHNIVGWVIGLAYIFIIKCAKEIDKNGHSNRIID